MTARTEKMSIPKIYIITKTQLYIMQEIQFPVPIVPLTGGIIVLEKGNLEQENGSGERIKHFPPHVSATLLNFGWCINISNSLHGQICGDINPEIFLQI